MEPRGKVSMTTKCWGLFINLLKIRKPTLFEYNDLLPNQPVPKLSDTINQYLASMIPLKSEKELDILKAKGLVFLDGSHLYASVRIRSYS